MLAAAVGEPPDGLTDAVRKHPDQADGYLARGDWYGRRGLWRKAADDFARAYRLQPEQVHRNAAGDPARPIGEADRYRDLCRQLLDQSAGTSEIYEADETLKTCCLLGPGPVGEAAQLARLADVAVSGDPTQPWSEWLLLASGLYEYRAGRFDAAVTTCRASRRRANQAAETWMLWPPRRSSIEAMALEPLRRRRGSSRLARRGEEADRREARGSFRRRAR